MTPAGDSACEGLLTPGSMRFQNPHCGNRALRSPPGWQLLAERRLKRLQLCNSGEAKRTLETAFPVGLAGLSPGRSASEVILRHLGSQSLARLRPAASPGVIVVGADRSPIASQKTAVIEATCIAGDKGPPNNRTRKARRRGLKQDIKQLWKGKVPRARKTRRRTTPCSPPP